MSDLEQMPFHVSEVFQDTDDVIWTREQLFKGVCDAHALIRDIKVRSATQQQRMKVHGQNTKH